MPAPATIHCDCGTDIPTAPADGTVTCPDCDVVFAARIVELPRDHDGSSPFPGIRSIRGP
ncbi:hypothetical protein B1756_05685 [Natrarchaeobaculum aegyptiacum]|uniref:Uncharacterized protein n=1 Tax=Natrarchaeobaculum aegyptiacum TaxID=745377 RepID=A0A2Z2HT52_9EURY|nr:hypothetical protein B1756_05685 [Natrarchaeobaculum aegyptiacum]